MDKLKNHPLKPYFSKIIPIFGVVKLKYLENREHENDLKQDINSNMINQYCSGCGKELPANWNFPRCPYCGKELPKDGNIGGGSNLSLGDANAIAGNVTIDSHNTVTNIVHERQKYREEIHQEKVQQYKKLCEMVYADGVMTSEEARQLENLRLDLGLDSAEADEIRSHAESEAVAIRNRAIEDGTREGLQKGTMEAQEQLDHMTTQLREQEQQIKNEYNDKYKTMEQDLVDTILGVLDHVFMAECSGKRDIVIHLIDVALSNADSSKEFKIHVSPAIAEKIADKQKDWQKYLGNDVQLDIIPDPLFKDQNCTIETDGGIFDCSLDTELDNLFRDIRALSYQE